MVGAASITETVERHKSHKVRSVAAELKGLRLKFPGEPHFVFKDLDFHIQKGEKVLLLGPSGSGKSTLLQVLSGIIPNMIEVPMRVTDKLIPASWGMVFQDPDTQFCMPYVDEELAFVLENLGIPQSEMSGHMTRVLEEVGLTIDDLHVPINTLSQGMKQRLALASVLLSDPEVLLLDEPSALLDPDGRKQIWQAVQRIAHNRTLVIVEHRIEEVLDRDLVDRVVLFGPDGKLIGQGSPDEIFDQHEVELKQFGIWYPGVWEHFFASSKGQEMLAIQSADLPSSLSPIIELSQFRGTRYGRTVIEAEHLQVRPGDFIAITGSNGAGKSSLLLSLMGLLRSEGSYILNGLEMVRGNKRTSARTQSQMIDKTASSIGFVFQNPEFQFIKDKVSDEISFSLGEAGLDLVQIQERTEAVLQQFRLAGLEHRHPYQLSLGQKRRLSVAGVTVLQRKVLLLDEPTFGQDAVNTFEIVSICEELRRAGTAIVMVTHEDIIANEIATQRWEVEDGRVERCYYTMRGMKQQELMSGSGESEGKGE